MNLLFVKTLLMEVQIYGLNMEFENTLRILDELQTLINEKELVYLRPEIDRYRQQF